MIGKGVTGAAALVGAALAITAHAEEPALPAPSASASVAASAPAVSSASPAAPSPASMAPAASPAPPSTSSPASSAHADDQPPTANLRPFGAGTEVSVTTPGVNQVTLFVGRAVDLLERPSDYDFVKVGKTPVTFQLPPGNYWLEVESPDVTRGSLLLRVDQQPKHLMVHTGSSGMGDLATLTLALGATAVLAATVILASGSSAKTDFDKAKIVIPLYIGGGVLLGGGVGLYFASRTNVKEPESATTAWRTWPGVLVGVTSRF
jgi:hypothetical protein